MPNVEWLQNLLDNGWGQVAILGGILHVVLTNKTMTKSFKELVIKIKGLEDFVLTKQVLDKTRDRDFQKMEKRITRLEDRVRDLEKSRPHMQSK